MTERAQRIMKAYEAEDTYNFPKDGVVSAIREIANCFDDWGDWGDEYSSQVFREICKIADEVEAL
jgi:hypothetical protein